MTRLALAVLMLACAPAAGRAQPFEPNARTLLLDHFDKPFTPDGRRCTAPAVITRAQAWTGGRPGAGGEFVPGMWGKAFRFHGLMAMHYPVKGNIDLSAGRVEFWVKMGFEPDLAKVPSERRNQLFFAVRGPGRCRLSIYSVLKSLCVGVWDRRGQLVHYQSLPSPWKQDEWHHVAVDWGRELALECDGRRTAKPWSGLFGPIAVKPEELRLQLGSFIGYSSVVSEFAIDELRILGPGGDQAPDYPLFVAPRMAKAPTIDGKLAPGEWDAAGRTSGFVGLSDPALVEDQTIVRMGYDARNLYVAYECLDPRQRPLVGTLTDRDASVWTEDAVDLFLQPWPAPGAGRGVKSFPYYQIVVSCRGTVADHRCVDPKTGRRVESGFNPKLTVKTSSAPGRWVAELALPFAEIDGLEAPTDGQRWRVNFCRDADATARLSSWAFTGGNFHRWSTFGEVEFRDDDRTLQLTQLGGWSGGRFQAELNLAGRAFNPAVTVEARVLDSSAKPVAAFREQLTDARRFRVAPPPLVTGLYTLQWRATSAAGRAFLSHRMPFRVHKAFDILAEAYPYAGKLWVTASVGGLEAKHKGLSVTAELRRNGKACGSCRIARFERGRGSGSIDIASLAPGKYGLIAKASASDGAVVAKVDYEFEQYARPAWWRSKAGVDHSVPPPWTPVESRQGTVRVWGREYVCGPGALARRIVNQKRDMLAGPVRWRLTAGGKTLELVELPARDVRAPADRAVREASGSLGDLGVTLRSTTEFDGLCRLDLTLTPKRPVTIDRLIMEIPVRRELATLMLSSTGRSSRAAEVTDAGWHGGFHPQVWVGDDDVGLAWFSPSDQYWKPRDDRMVEVAPDGDSVVIRANMIREARRITGPATITCGLAATPVKRVPRADPFWFRFGVPVGVWDLDKPEKTLLTHPESLAYPGAGHVAPQAGTLECWVAPAATATDGWHDLATVAGQGGGVRTYVKLVKGQVAAVQLQSKRAGKPWSLVGAVKAPTDGFAHVALTWGKKTAWRVNGRRLKAADGPLWDAAAMAKAPEKLTLKFGAPSAYRGHTRLVVDEVRLSKGARYAGDTYAVPAGPFAPDADTLLLDHLDDAFRPDGEDGETRAAVIGPAGERLGGVPSIGCRFVTGRFGKALEIAMRPKRPSLEVLRDEWGANASLWWRYLPRKQADRLGWPLPLFTRPEGADQAKLTDAFAKAGLRVVPYALFYGMGAPSALSRQFGAEWRREPESTLPAAPPAGHVFLACCGESGYADYAAAGTAWLMDEQGFDGAYTDGNGCVFPCKNTRHGCGYRDEQGVLRPTWPIFGTREYLKRMYKVIHARRPNGYLVNHVSYELFIPTMAFTDVYYTGEHEHYEDLVKFRTRWQGAQWGVWPILLGADAHAWRSMHMAYCLLHGVSVWPQGPLGRNDVARKTANVWRAYDAYGYRTAEWIPYYRAEREGLVRASSSAVKCSLYLHRGERALLIVSNLGGAVATPTLALDLAGLGLAGKSLAASNVLTGRRLELAGTRLKLRLRPKTFVLAGLN